MLLSALSFAKENPADKSHVRALVCGGCLMDVLMRVICLCGMYTDYFSTPSSLPTLMNAAMHLSRCSRSCAAEICTRIRACPWGTTG